MNCITQSLLIYLGSLPLCFCLAAVMLGPLYLLIRLYNSGAIGEWWKYAAIAWLLLSAPALASVTCYYPKQVLAVVDALVIDVDRCDCATDRSEEPGGVSPRTRNEERDGVITGAPQ